MTSDKNVTWDLYPMRMLKRFLTDRSGATAIEYGLIATLISVAIIGGATAVGNGVGNLFNVVSDKVVNATK